jgi:pimeloyl-ACP methyl ester carboxylesterase
MITFTYKAFKRLIFNRYTFAVIVLIIVFTAGILSKEKVFKPDLHRLYMETMMVDDQPPVVFIHGVLGSKLKNVHDQKNIWPGPASHVLFHDYSDLAMDIDALTLEPSSPDVVAYEVSDQAFGKDFYGKIIDTLGDVGEYKYAEIGQRINPKEKNYYVFYYDWRQDNVKSAKQLADFIDQIRLEYQQPDLKVDLVAHSMGGLISRYFIRYGKQDVLDGNDFDQKINLYGGERVRRVILLGTPNLGSVRALQVFITGVKLGFKEIGTETLATMPSLYQLFPHPLNDWLVTAEGKPLERDLFDVRIWRRFQWSIFNPDVRERIRDTFDTAEEAEAHLTTLEAFFEKSLERARRFVWSLTIPLPENHPKLVVFGGACNLTPARILVEEVDGESMVRIRPEEVTQPVAGIDYDELLLEPGDGSVTKASLLGRNTLDPSVKRHKYSFFPLDHSVFLCVSHNSLTGNLNFQDNLLNTLLSRDEDTL